MPRAGYLRRAIGGNGHGRAGGNRFWAVGGGIFAVFAKIPPPIPLPPPPMPKPCPLHAAYQRPIVGIFYRGIAAFAPTVGAGSSRFSRRFPRPSPRRHQCPNRAPLHAAYQRPIVGIFYRGIAAFAPDCRGGVFAVFAKISSPSPRRHQCPNRAPFMPPTNGLS